MSEDQGKPDTRGTVRDWPAWVLLAGIAAWVYNASIDRKPPWLVFVLIGFGAVAWLVRSGKFNPRR